MKFVIAALLALLAGPASAQSSATSSLYLSQAPSTTVAALPTCSAGLSGVSFIVTNALTPVFLATVAAGGAVVVRVTCNGTAWIVG